MQTKTDHFFIVHHFVVVTVILFIYLHVFLALVCVHEYSSHEDSIFKSYHFSLTNITSMRSSLQNISCEFVSYCGVTSVRLSTHLLSQVTP